MKQRSITFLSAVGILIILAPAITSCTKQPQAVATQQASATSEPPVAAALRSEPWNMISASEVEVEREGDSTRAVSLTLTNRSSARVGGLEGFLTYQNADGGDITTVHFTADGELAPMETKTMPITADAIAGVSDGGRARITKAQYLPGQ